MSFGVLCRHGSAATHPVCDNRETIRTAIIKDMAIRVVLLYKDKQNHCIAIRYLFNKTTILSQKEKIM